MTRPLCLELFAGAGGAALGIEAAGFEHAALVERDPDACATMRRIWHDAVIEADVRELARIDQAVEGEIDLLWSSWPCQPFSNAGARRGADDERNGWPWTVAAIDHFRPLVFIGENVRGLLSFPYFEQVVLPDLRQRFAHVGWWLLDAADYGVPQHRRRVFVWAAPSRCLPPKRTHGPGMFTLPWVSMGQALQIEASSMLHHGRNTAAHPKQERPRPATEPAPTIGGQGNQILQRPSTTICSADGHGLSCPAVRDRLEAATGRRRLTVDECATLQGFPPGYARAVMVGTARSRYRQVGNAVPPALAEAVVRAVCPVMP